VGAGRGLHPVQIELGIREGLDCRDHHRQISRPAASHHCVNSDLLDGALPLVGRNETNDFGRITSSASEHVLDAGWRGWYNWQSICPAPLKVKLDRFFRISNWVSLRL
jgi:hypothetical protein